MDMPTNCPLCGEVVEFDEMVRCEGDHKFICQDCTDSLEVEDE